jgi:hypothetical protein
LDADNERLYYEDDEEFNRYFDDQEENQTSYRIILSKSLFDQDIVDYTERRREFNEQKTTIIQNFLNCNDPFMFATEFHYIIELLDYLNRDEIFTLHERCQKKMNDLLTFNEEDEFADAIKSINQKYQELKKIDSLKT